MEACENCDLCVSKCPTDRHLLTTYEKVLSLNIFPETFVYYCQNDD